MTPKKNTPKREEISLVGLKRDEQEFSEALTTDIRILNRNKFFFNPEGEKDTGSQK